MTSKCAACGGRVDLWAWDDFMVVPNADEPDEGSYQVYHLNHVPSDQRDRARTAAAFRAGLEVLAATTGAERAGSTTGTSACLARKPRGDPAHR